MMRAGLVALALAVAAGPASGDPPPGPKTEESEAEKAGEPASQPQLRVAEPPRAGSIDLFPESVFGSSRKSPEEKHRLTLGNDESWKAQAVQVGAMAAVFGALVGLCGGGKCLIPSGATDFLPDWMTAEPTTYHSPRREQPLREAR